MPIPRPSAIFINSLILIIIALTIPLAHAQQYPPGHRIALIIGNAAYPGTGALKNPANDANDIAAKLRKFNFDVTLKTNVGQRDMLRALTEFGDKVQQGSEVLFFYAGHGMQVRGKNYLIPIDAEIRTENSVSSEAVDVDQLLDKLAAARLSMVILDACRNNPFERRFRGGGQGLAQINAPTGTLIAYATAPGKVAADGEGRNGLYTAELLTALDTPGIKVEDVFKRVRANVVKKSGEVQTPWESSSLTGDFYFVFQGPATIQMQPAADPETDYWNEVKASGRKEFFTAYLKEYPQGKYAALARLKLAEFEKSGLDASSGSQPSNRIQPGISKSMNLAEYCNSKYGPSAQVNNVRTDAYSWSCSIDGRVQAIDMADVCRVQHGNQYKPQVANPKDSYTWSCQ
jgi:hypothetical protein